jgi:hypothetical protein
MAAAAGGGGGESGGAGVVGRAANRRGQLVTILRRQGAIQPLIYSDLITGAQLIASGLATEDEMIGWLRKFDSTDGYGISDLLDDLWRSMATEEREHRWNKYLEGEIDKNLGYTQEMFDTIEAGYNMKNRSVLKWIKPVSPSQFINQKMAQLKEGEVGSWMIKNGIKFIAQIFNAVVQPVTAENREIIKKKRHMLALTHTLPPYTVNKAEAMRNIVMKRYVAPSRGGKRSTSKRRSVTNKRRISHSLKRKTYRRRSVTKKHHN